MIEILHNPRCRKSREGLAILESEDKDFKIIKYLVNNLSLDELKAIILKLNIPPIELVRKNEAVWKSEFKGEDLSDTEIMEAMVKYPKLIERPIVINKNKAVIGRPAEIIKTIL